MEIKEEIELIIQKEKNINDHIGFSGGEKHFDEVINYWNNREIIDNSLPFSDNFGTYDDFIRDLKSVFRFKRYGVGNKYDIITYKEIEKICVEEVKTKLSTIFKNLEKYVIKYEQKKDEYKPIKKTFDQVIKDFEIFKVDYDWVPVAPEGPYNVSRNNFLNIFDGFSAKRIDDYENKIVFVKDFILNNLCESNDNNYNFLLDWIAHIIQFPEEKVPVCVILYSEDEGTGKSLFCSFLRNIIGKKHTGTSKDIDDIVGHFNTILDKKLLLICEEATASNKNQKDYETLKQIISEKDINCVEKFKNAKQIRNYSRIIIPTNNSSCVRINASSRRFFILNTIKRDDKNYYTRLASDFDNKDIQNAFFTYLLERKIKSNLQVCPKTEKFEEMLEEQNLEIQFIKLITWKNSKPLKDIFEKYIEYCRINHYDNKICDSRIFAKKISKYIKQDPSDRSHRFYKKFRIDSDNPDLINIDDPKYEQYIKLAE
jgi:hypothetical protein